MEMIVDDYAIIISLYFAKAFDTVRHSALAQKLSTLELPDSIYNWLVEFLQGRTHSTLFAVRGSPVGHINASIIQGSGLGLSKYVVCASDLHPVYEQNRIAKFADDTYLIIPSSFESMADAADVCLLRAVVASDAHVLRQFFPPVAKLTYNLHPRKRPFLLPPKDDRYFVSRVLFK